MGYSQRLQKHLKACRSQHPYGQEMERACLCASVEGSPAIHTHLIPEGCSNRARLGVALGKSLSSQRSLIPVRLWCKRKTGRASHSSPTPATGKTNSKHPKCQGPLKSSASVSSRTGTEVQSGNPNLWPSFLRSFLGEGGRGPKAPHKHLQDRPGVN